MRPVLQIPRSPARGTEIATIKKRQTHEELSTTLAFLCPGRSPSPPSSSTFDTKTCLLKQSHISLPAP